MRPFKARFASISQILTTLLCALATAGCDECEIYGQLRCDGDVLSECIDDGDGPFANFRWVVRGCAVTCHQSGGRAGSPPGRCEVVTTPVSGPTCVSSAG